MKMKVVKMLLASLTVAFGLCSRAGGMAQKFDACGFLVVETSATTADAKSGMSLNSRANGVRVAVSAPKVPSAATSDPVLLSTASSGPAKKVLIWQPYRPIASSVDCCIGKLKTAYEDQIPSGSFFGSKYPDGIAVDVYQALGADDYVELPSSLDSYALVFVMFPSQQIKTDQVDKLKTVVARGGRIVMQCENGGCSPTENAMLTLLAMDMGVDFEITSQMLGGGSTMEYDVDVFNRESDLLREDLQGGVYPRSICVAHIRYSGLAQEVARMYFRTASNFAVWVVDQVSLNGRITAISDINWYDYEASDALTRALPFLERLLSNAIACEQKVIDEENPNQDIDEKIPDGMVAAVRDENDFLTYYATVAAACTAACSGRDATNRLTVILKRDVRENFTLPVGVTFETTGVTTNYDREATISVDAGALLSVNAAHDVYYASTAALPGSPAVSATDGAYTNKVLVTWTTPSSDLPVTAYHVWRVKVGSTLVTELTNSVTGLSYEDRTAKPGVRYTYYVSAYSSAGWGFEGSDGGWRGISAVTGVSDVTARQRYPWNGKVDVDFEVTGDAEATYRVGLKVADAAGGTNLPVRTVLGETLVSPGRHRLVWDADADIAADGKLPRLKVSVTAEEE